MTDLAHQALVGREVRLGKAAPVEDDRTLQLARYFAPTLPPPPVALPRLEQLQIVSSWGMMKNDQYGDCTCAALGHASQTWSALAKKKVHTPSDDDVFKLYIPDTGSDDDGRVELEVLKYVRKHGLFHHKVRAFAQVSLHSRDLIKSTIELFGLAYIGLALPRSAQSQKVWDVVTGSDSQPGSWGGHAVILVEYDEVGPTCITWGTPLKMTWQFFQMYCDEAYAIIESEWFKKGKTPDGLELSLLKADLEAIS